jgi:CheY-like chemotaxis protein
VKLGKIPEEPVLIVDDDEDCREMLATLLVAHGYRIVTAENGAEALTVARQYRPCLILLDLMMPVMDGEEFRRTQLTDPQIRDIPIVVVSARIGAAEIAGRLGAVGVIPKPLDLDQVAATIEEVCAKQQM